ncbi:uncharacterized protein IL334_005407 [Kwoniella shivajii]|uniref:RING-type E3 ubiquitin transferase n=1 Tax=Kwoniella shivajii TaxID=564305 RepID=A0ABZ1D3L6_9TREE|nr:hypothetical protein IL334_005407 [Kwoniella shivajii]
MPTASPFWLCHECGAQMRPVTIDGVSHCASCNGEFIEILDAEVNPDPFHELPPAPPTRPNEHPSSPLQYNPNAFQSNAFQPSPGQGGQSFLSGLFGNILGAAADSQGGSSNRPIQPPANRATSPTTNTGGSGSRGRSFSFNFPGGGRGQVMFGFGGGMGPFGPTGQAQQGGPIDFERQGRPAGAQDEGVPMEVPEMLRALMAAMGDEGNGPGLFFGGPGRGNVGDYATSERPLPASDIVIDGLPRFKFDDEKKLDDFGIGDEVVRIPCARFSLVPEDADRRPAQAQPQGNSEPQEGAQSAVTNILNRLFGQGGGATSNPNSPTEDEPRNFPFGAADEATGSGDRTDATPQAPPRPPQPTSPSPSIPTSGQPAVEDDHPVLPTAIPDDYRARHRERERQRHQEEHQE